MELFDAIFVSLILAIAIVIFAFIKKGMKRQTRATQIWRDLARLKNLEEVQGDKYGDEEATIIAFQGKNQGMPFLLECIATEGTPVQVGSLKLSSGEDVRIFTRMQISLPYLPRGLRVYRKKLSGKLGTAIGMQDISTGDPEFDQAFVVKGTYEREVQDYLTSARRMALLAQASEMDGLELQEYGLILFRPDQIATLEELEKAFSQIGSLATALMLR
jgi:hypothetical protein